MSERRTGAAVVGLGVGAEHARAYAVDERCRLVALVDLDPQRAEALAEELPHVRVAADFEEVLADPDVDVVSIASSDDAHYAQALAALRAGKHVFVEKPLCRTLEEMRTLSAELAARPELRLASNLVLRGAPFYRWLKDECAAGGLGRVYAFDGDYLFGRVHKITEGWRKDVDEYSVMLGGGVHLVDVMLWTTGERPAHVTASGNRIATEGTEFRYLDFVSATFEFPSGLVGRITANFGSVHPHQHVVRLFGTQASVVHDDAGPRMYRERDPAVGPDRLELATVPGSKGVLIGDFVDRILSGDASRRAEDHEFAVISACVAADRALREGSSVDVEYP